MNLLSNDSKYDLTNSPDNHKCDSGVILEPFGWYFSDIDKTDGFVAIEEKATWEETSNEDINVGGKREENDTERAEKDGEHHDVLTTKVVSHGGEHQSTDAAGYVENAHHHSSIVHILTQQSEFLTDAIRFGPVEQFVDCQVVKVTN